MTFHILKIELFPIRLAWFVALFLALANQAHSASQTQSQTNAAYEAALDGLDVFPSLLSAQTMARFGFNSTNELNAMQLGHPLPIHELPLPILFSWMPSDGVSNALFEAELAIFPVIVSNEVRSAITVRKQLPKWEVVRFGGGNLARLYSNIRATNAVTTGVPLTEHFAVSVQPLHAYFVGYPVTNQFMLVSVASVPELGLTNGVPITAEAVFRTLARAARRMRDYPR